MISARQSSAAGRPVRLPAFLFGAGTLALVSCASVDLRPPTTRGGQGSNVVARGGDAYVALGEGGLGIVDVASGRTVRTIAAAAPAGSVDDLALDGDLLFALDARPPGQVWVWSLAAAREPVTVSAPQPVPVGPFSGVSAARGRVVVSGGTSELTVATYDALGKLGRDRFTLDLGRGQPDVLLSPRGDVAWVSTHFSLVRATYGLTALRLGPPGAPRAAGTVELPDAGFTPGAAKPANFALDAALAGEALLVAHGGGLAVIDVRDAARPALVRVVDLGVRAVNVDVRGARAAVVGSDPEPALVLLDVRDAAKPRVARRLRLPEGSTPLGVALTETHAVIAAERGALVVPL
jgi:hypothetical protein